MNEIDKKLFTKSIIQYNINSNSIKTEEQEDEEQVSKYIEIIEMLVQAGYYRARINGLSSFDKIVGGMTWCMESCNYDVDVDLLFQENSTIGQKIALTEKIVVVLPKMNCPHFIEPHQIQGLDYFHIYPVVQWLVKESMITRENMRQYVRNYGVTQFNKKYLKLFETARDSEDSKIYQNAKLIREALMPAKISKEKSQYLNNEQTVTDMLEKKKVYLDKQKQILTSQVRQAEDGVLQIKKRLKAYKNKMIARENELNEDEPSANHTNAMKLINKVEQQLVLYDKIKEQEQKFREQCIFDSEVLNNFINGSENFETQGEPNNNLEYNRLKTSVNTLRLKLAKANRSIAYLIRQLDEIPGRFELSQYQKRFMELYNQVSAKLKETKQYYTLYNTLTDTKLYLSKELSILDSIYENYDEAMVSHMGKDQFLQQFKVIIEGIKRSKSKVEKRCLEEKNQRKVLNGQLMSSIEQQRKYFTAVRQLKIECRKNEMLLAQIKSV